MAKHKAEIRRKRNKIGRRENIKKKSKKKNVRMEEKREDRRNKFFSRTPRAISQIAHRVKMVCMGAVGLPRTFRLLQIPTQKTPGTASTKTSAVIYFYPGSMPPLCTHKLCPSLYPCEYQHIAANYYLYPFSASESISTVINTRHFSLLEKSN